MFVAPGGVVQIAIATVVSFSFFALSMRCTPYRHPAHDIVKALTEITIFLVLISVMLMKPSLVSKKLDALSNATVVVCLSMGILIVFFTVRAAKNLIGEILEEMEGLEQRSQAPAASVQNPMTETFLGSELTIAGSDDDAED